VEINSDKPLDLSVLVSDLPRNHPESYHYYMWNNFFKHIDIDPANVHILDGNAPNLHEECDEFERKIIAAGGVELFIGGEKVKHLLYFAVHCPSFNVLSNTTVSPNKVFISLFLYGVFTTKFAKIFSSFIISARIPVLL